MLTFSQAGRDSRCKDEQHQESLPKGYLGGQLEESMYDNHGTRSAHGFTIAE
jgi:hypothetical protein